MYAVTKCYCISSSKLKKLLTLSLRSFHLSFIFSKSFSRLVVLTPPAADWMSPCPSRLQSSTWCARGSMLEAWNALNSSCCARMLSTSEPTGFSSRTLSLACKSYHKINPFKLMTHFISNCYPIQHKTHLKSYHTDILLKVTERICITLSYSSKKLKT